MSIFLGFVALRSLPGDVEAEAHADGLPSFTTPKEATGAASVNASVRSGPSDGPGPAFAVPRGRLKAPSEGGGSIRHPQDARRPSNGRTSPARSLGRCLP
jgi:hypothetical protein